jgi:hypothetical protein
VGPHEANRRLIIGNMGRPMVLARNVGATNPPTYQSVTLTGFVSPFTQSTTDAKAASQSASFGVALIGNQSVRINNDEIAAAAWPAPPRRNDRVIFDGMPRTLQGADPVYEGAKLIGWTLWVAS